MATRRVLVEILGDEASLTRAFAKGGAEAKGFGRTLNVVTRQTGGFSRGFLSGAGALSSFGGALALTSGSFFAGAGIVAGLKASVGAAGNFQQTMNVLQQTTGATAAQLKAAGAEAQALGADITLPATSATDAAQAMLQLAKGGLTLKEAMAATRGTLQLAAAAQTDVATASNETARALTTFNLTGAHAGEIADLLANGAASATGDIQDFALALSQSGTSAHQFGLTARDTVTAITELAKSGILGSDAGTSLRVMLTRLLPTSKAAQREIKRLGVNVHDASGNFLPFRDIISQYSTALAKLSPAQRQFALQTIFGTDAQRAANIILTSGVKGFDNLSSAVSKQGGAAQRAAAQQKGFKGALDGFNSALQTTEVTVGTALLPVLTKYLRELSKWLSTSQNQQKIQHDVTVAVKDTTAVVKGFGEIIKTVDRVTGSFVHTLELLAAVKIGTSLGRAAISLGLVASSEAKVQAATVAAKDAQEAHNAELVAIGLKADNSAVKLGKLKGAMVGLNEVTIAAIAIPIVFEITTKILDKTGATGLLKRAGGAIADRVDPAAGGFLSGASGQQERAAIKFARAQLDAGKAVDKVTTNLVLSTKFGKLTMDEIGAIVRIALEAKQKLQEVGVSMEQITAQAEAVRQSTSTLGDTPLTAGRAGGKPLTASQRNTFFDNDVARILLRGGLGDLRQQTAAINQAVVLLTARIAATKDITRKKNLEDQLLQLQAQRRDIVTQIATQAGQAISASLALGLEKAQATTGFKDDLAALNAINANLEQRIKTEGKTTDLMQQLFENRQAIRDTQQKQRDAAQFFSLGLSPTGGVRTPQVPRLKKEVSSITEKIAGTFLDTSKNRGLLAAAKKILEAAIPPDDQVRQAIQSMFDTINDELKKGAHHLTKFKKVSQDALLSGLGLDPATKRRIEQALAGVGAGGTRPGGSSPSFAGAGAKVPPVNLYLDGKKLADNTSDHQSRTSKNRSSTRRGPYAGRH